MKEHPEFNGDGFIRSELEKLIERFGIAHVIETGTWAGESTIAFREMVKGRVVTIDISHDTLTDALGIDAAATMFEKGIDCVIGDSGEFLREIIRNTKMMDRFKYYRQGRILYYLDAHGYGNPLIEELAHIAEYDDSPVIAIHDFYTPDNDVLGFNMATLNGRHTALSMPAIKDSLDKVYPDGYSFHFNNRDEAEGAMRGIVYIYPNVA